MKKTASKKSAAKKSTKGPRMEGGLHVSAAAPKPTRAGLAYSMIQAGKTNLDVLQALQKQFNLPESHSYYPSWYRAKLVSLGTITAEWAKAHRGPQLRRTGPEAGSAISPAATPVPAPAKKAQKAHAAKK